MAEPSVQNPLPVTIRTYRPEDREAVRKLYLEGLVGGKIASNDTGLDIDDIQGAYLSSPDSRFWVAVNQQGEVVGNIGVQQCEDGLAEIRRLRVRQDSRRRGVGSAHEPPGLVDDDERRRFRARKIAPDAIQHAEHRRGALLLGEPGQDEGRAPLI